MLHPMPTKSFAKWPMLLASSRCSRTCPRQQFSVLFYNSKWIRSGMSVYPLVAGFSPGSVRMLLTHGIRTKMKPHILLSHQHLCGLTVTLRSAMRTGGQHVYRIATAKSATDGMEGGHHLDQRPLRETAWMMPQQVSKSWSPQRTQGVHPKPPWTVKRLIPHFQQSAGRRNCRTVIPSTDQICTNRAHASK